MAGADAGRETKEVLRRALGHRVVKNQEALNIKEDGLMHEHAPREAHLIERYLRSGTTHPDVLHSFVHGDTYVEPQKMAQPELDERDDLPDFDVVVQHTHSNLQYPGHFHPGLGEFQPGHTAPHEMHAPQVVEQQLHLDGVVQATRHRVVVEVELPERRSRARRRQAQRR